MSTCIHTHTEHNKRGAIGLFCDHLRNGSWQPDTANFEEGVGEEPTAIGSEALSLPCPETARLPPGKAGFVWLLPPPGRKSVMLSLLEARAHQWLHRWHEDPCAAWQAFRDIIFTNAMLTRVAASTSLGKKLISITNNTFLIAANRYGIPETTPLATDKSPPSPLAFSAMEKREDVSTQSCKKERWSQHLLCDSLLPLITYSTFRARQMQLPPAPSPPWATSPALPSIGPSPPSLFLLWSCPNWEREGIWGTYLWRGKFLCMLTKAISGTSLPSPDFRTCRAPPVKALRHQPALAAPGPEDRTKTHRPND